MAKTQTEALREACRNFLEQLEGLQKKGVIFEHFKSEWSKVSKLYRSVITCADICGERNLIYGIETRMESAEEYAEPIIELGEQRRKLNRFPPDQVENLGEAVDSIAPYEYPRNTFHRPIINPRGDWRDYESVWKELSDQTNREI